MVVSLAPFLTVMPIVSFLFVFIIMYALLVKTELLGKNNAVSLMLSFIIAIFFIINVRLVEFVRINVSWFVVFFICLFLIMLILGFVGKDSALKTVTENKAVAWVLLAALIIVFIFSAGYVFNWALNWDSVQSWFNSSWGGMVVLLVIAGVVSAVLAKS